MNTAQTAIISLVALSLLASIYAYPAMPQEMTSHWNAESKADGKMPKLWALFLLPIISIALALAFLLIPKIDPLKTNIAKFRKYYDSFIALIIAFMLYLHILTILWNLDFKFDMIRLMAPGFACLFYGAGVLMENSGQNWFVGIRTPWTMSNEKVWSKTNKLGGKLFKISGAIALLALVLPSLAMPFIIAPVILSAIYAAVYSYLEYEKIKKKN